MTTFWRLATKTVKFINSNIKKITNKFLIFDKLTIALAVTKAWAYVGLYTVKILEKVFVLILSMPDKWLILPDRLVSQIYNTSGQKIKIISAHTDSDEITNKLKLFLKFYWEKGGLESSSMSNGFDFMKLRQFLNCSMLYCYYLLTDKNGTVTPEQFIVDCEDLSNPGVICYILKKTNKSNKRKLVHHHVNFDAEEKKDNISLDDMVKDMMIEFD